MDFADVYGRPLYEAKEWKSVIEKSNPLFIVITVISAVAAVAAAVAILMSSMRTTTRRSYLSGKNAP